MIVYAENPKDSEKRKRIKILEVISLFTSPITSLESMPRHEILGTKTMYIFTSNIVCVISLALCQPYQFLPQQ